MADQLDLRDLRYFEVIAETGNMARAARALFRTQPALTGCVRRLEATLGTRLFERVGRAVCREVLKRAPGITLKTVIGHNDVLRNGLKTGELDVVVSFSAHGDEGLASHDILEDEVVVAASRNHPIFRKRVSQKAMLDYGWVLAGPGVATRDWIDHAFTTRGLEAPRVQIETNLILLLPPLIEQSNLLTFVSRRHLGIERGFRLREVAARETTMKRRFAVTYRKDSYLSPAARRLVELLREEGAALFEERGGTVRQVMSRSGAMRPGAAK
jgi:DNA-binding transcriptional LysR family regulator